MIRFAAPLLLAFAVPLALYGLWRLRSLPRDHTGWRRRAIQAVMGLALVCGALAVGGLEQGTRLDRMAVVFVLDRSRSVERTGGDGPTKALEQLRRATERMRPDDKAGLVVFGSEAATEVLPSANPPLGVARAPVARDGTDIAAAIRRALADLPAEHAGHIVLVSDGVETQGDALDAAAVAAGRGVAIDVLQVERTPSPEVAVQQVRAPAYADPHQPVELRIVTRSTRATEVNVRVTRDGEVIAEARTSIAAGEDVLTMRDEAPAAGVHRYDVIVDPLDPDADVARENNEGAAFMRVTGGSRVLVLAGAPQNAGALADAIRRAGVEVDLRGPNSAPADIGTLAGYDLLVLSDVNARTFSEDQMAMVASYVRDLGGGLLMLGARDAFGLGGYAYTPIEETLPATFDLRKRRDRASLAMVIAIDKSGSMGADVGGGRNKLDLANEAAARSAMLLSPFDRVGVVHVDTSDDWTQPMTFVRNPAAIAANVRRASVGGGGILVDFTLEVSYQRLRSESTQLKHLLLFSDGSDSEAMTNARSLVAGAARDGITTSIVSMGNGPDTPELEQLSRIGGGRFYIVEDMTQAPRIFTQETIEASRSAIIDTPFRALVGEPGPPTRGVDFRTAPALGGYCTINQRPQATRLLSATAEDPLLLTWQRGVGRAGVFATDAGSNFGRSWLAWPGYAQMFGQLARDLSRAPERRDAQVNVTVEGGVGRVRIEAVDADGRYRNYLDLSASIAAPDGRHLDLPLAQTGAGRYEATFDASAPGAYLASVREMGRGMVGSAGAVRARGDELRGEGTDRAKLAQIAALTGGRVRRDLASVFTERPPPVYAYAPRWPALLTAAVLLLLLSVAMRRLVLPRELLARLLPAGLRARLGVRPARAIDPTATLAALGAARDRAATSGAARELAPEVRRALEARPGSGSAPSAGAAAPPPGDASAPAAAPAPPPVSTLAEKLLEKKRKR